jgi:hypothetical protein
LFLRRDNARALLVLVRECLASHHSNPKEPPRLSAAASSGNASRRRIAACLMTTSVGVLSSCDRRWRHTTNIIRPRRT